WGGAPSSGARGGGGGGAETVVAGGGPERLGGGILVGEDRGPQALRGVREPMVLYRVVQPSGVRSRLDVAAGRLTPFVGRELELGTLLDRWERAAEGEGQNVLGVGEAGGGQTPPGSPPPPGRAGRPERLRRKPGRPRTRREHPSIRSSSSCSKGSPSRPRRP